MTEDIQDAEYTESTMPVQHQQAPQNALVFAGDPTQHLAMAEKLVKYLAAKCSGEKYVATVDNKNYPRVEWWTTIGAGLQLFPREESCRRIDVGGGTYAYEAIVSVCRDGRIVTRAGALCRSDESIRTRKGETYNRWDDEYAVRSMAVTRATAKAYRLGLSFMAVMAELEPTPAEEVPSGGFSDRKSASQQRQNTPPQHTQQAEGKPGDPGVFHVEEVKELKRGTNSNGEWVLSCIKTKEGTEFTTFSNTDTSIAGEALEAGSPVRIEWTEKQVNGRTNYQVKHIEHANQNSVEADTPTPTEGGTDQTVIVRVETRQKKIDGNPTTVYVVHGDRQLKYGTWDDELGKKALSYAGTGTLLNITWEPDKRGRLITDIAELGDDDNPF